jgi:hypothetical protein
MKDHLKIVNEIQNIIREKIEGNKYIPTNWTYIRSYTTLTDITRILQARETDNWNEVYTSRLYRLHSGEYCELLSVIHRYTENKIVS